MFYDIFYPYLQLGILNIFVQQIYVQVNVLFVHNYTRIQLIMLVNLFCIRSLQVDHFY